MMHVFIILATIYGALLLGMAVFQRKLMYHPEALPVSPHKVGLEDFTEIMIESDDGTPLQLWHREANSGLPTVVYFHGNAGSLANRAEQFSAFAKRGLGVAAVSYRGYGKSQGKPTEHGILKDAQAAVKWLKSRGIAASNCIYYGESLGTGVAVRMARIFHPRALFLQAPYTSVVNRAAEMYWFVPVKLLIRDRFDSIAHIQQVRVPLVIFHGRLDNVIPPHHGERLYALANEPKQLILFDTVDHVSFDPHVIAQHVMNTLQ